MKQAICHFIYHRILGWRYNVSVPNYDKYILCAAPHTTNWDLIIGKLFYEAIGRKAFFMMKKEWFFEPLGTLFRWMGGIPVNRNKKDALVEQMILQVQKHQFFHLAITPEGTRSANEHWKRGFYYIALQAQIPIILVGIDYSRKCITMTKEVWPTGDIEKEMREIKLYFKGFKGKYPDKFTIGEIE